MLSSQLDEGQQFSLPTPGEAVSLISVVVRRRLGAISAGVLALVVTTLAFRTYHLFDFRVFWDAGHRLLTGSGLYPSEAALNANTRDYFVYPPVVAFAFAPLSMIPYTVAAVLYGVACVAAIFASLRIVGVTRFVGAAALGVAIASKLFLWPVVFWLIATRRYRRALETIAVTGAAVVIPWLTLGFRDFAEYPRVLRLLVHNEMPTSFSINALTEMLGLAQAALVVQLVCVVAVFALARRQEGDRRAFSAAIITALVLSPLVWIHYYLLLIVPIGIAFRRLRAVWLLPVLAFWPFPDNLSSVWPVLWVSLVMGRVAVLTLRASGLERPAPGRGSFEDGEARPARTSPRMATRKPTRVRNPGRRRTSQAR